MRRKKIITLLFISITSTGLAQSALTTTNSDSLLNKTPSPVATQPAVLQIKRTLKVPIIIAAEEWAKISSPLSALIAKTPFRNGQIFKTGDILIAFDCTVMKAEQKKMQATARYFSQKKSDFQKLYDLGGASQTELNEIISRSEEVQEELKIKNHIVSHCNIKAPFDGQVIELFVSQHEYLDQGKPLIEIINLDKLEVKLILPSEWLSWIKIGSPFVIELNETQKKYAAKISRLTYAIDAVSNTIIAYGEISQNHPDIKPGMSGIAEFKEPS